MPDSNWFTNRLGTRAVTVDELLKGPDTGNGPAPGNWTVIAAKNDGVTPGFTVRDSTGQVWFLKFDPPGYRGMATGTEVVVTKLFWALGYYVPEVHLASLRPDQLAIDDTARITPPSGNRRRFKQSDIQTLLAQGASRGGRLVPRHRQQGARRASPSAASGSTARAPTIRTTSSPHEHRRELRAYGTFAAWVNHVDSKSINTLDTVIDQDGRKVVRHNLLDFGSTVGSAGVYPREPFEGSEYLVEGKKTLAGIPTFGFYIKNWRTIPLYRARSVGAFPIDHSDVGPGEVEAALRQLRLPVGATRRQVLGRAPPPGISPTRC